MHFSGVLYINQSNNHRYYNLEKITGQLHITKGVFLPYLKTVRGRMTVTDHNNFCLFDVDSNVEKINNHNDYYEGSVNPLINLNEISTFPIRFEPSIKETI
jgi:hypothetical protein